jgi:hypothetical protein
MKLLQVWCSAVIVGGAAGDLSAQAKDPTVRAFEDKGVYFKLPSGWQWASDTDRIQIKQTFKVKDEEIEITGDMVFETKKFADAQKKDIQKKVEESKGTLKDLKFSKSKLGVQKCHLATFTRTRGEGPDQRLFEERIFFFKRGDGCFTWTEQNSKKVSSQASGAFDAARKAFTYKNTAETSISDVREIAPIKASYKLPEDFEWGDRADAKKGEAPSADEPVIRLVTEVDVKDNSLRCQFAMRIQEIEQGKKADLSTIYPQMVEADPAKAFVEPLHDVSDYKVDKKGDLAGEKCVFRTWVGAFEKNGPKNVFNQMIFVRKNHLVFWTEIVPWSKTKAPEVEAAVKAARGGFTF